MENILTISQWGAWVAQLVRRATLDFGSCHNLTVCEIEPHFRLHAISEEPAWDSLSPSLSLSLPTLEINKHEKNKKHVKISLTHESRKTYIYPNSCKSLANLPVSQVNEIQEPKETYEELLPKHQPRIKR